MSDEYYPSEPTQTPIAYTSENQAASAIIEYLNPMRVLEDFEHSLKGEVIDYENSTATERVYRRMPEFRKMNDKGVNWVMAKLRAHISPNIILSRYTERQIAQIMKTLTKELALTFTLKWREWEIDKSELLSISMDMLRMIHATYLRTLNESDKNLLEKLFRSVERIESVVQSQEARKKKWDPFGILKR